MRSNTAYPDLLPIYSEHLTDKQFNFENVTKTVMEIMNSQMPKLIDNTRIS
jgi:hypothetical protein